MSELKPSSNTFDNVKSAAEIFIKYGDFIRSVINCQVRDMHLRKDIYQGFFVKLSIKPLPEGIDEIKLYLYRMVCNHVNDVLRKQEIYHKHLNQHNEEVIRKLEQAEDNDLEEFVETESIFELIESNISEYLANVVMLRHKEKMSNAEIAEKLNLGQASVKAYYSLAIKKLREKLKN